MIGRQRRDPSAWGGMPTSDPKERGLNTSRCFMPAKLTPRSGQPDGQTDSEMEG